MKRKPSPHILIFVIILISTYTISLASSPAIAEQTFIHQSKLLASDKESYAEFGAVIALSQDEQIMVVGAPLKDIGSNNNQGQIYIFRRNGNTWIEEQQLSASDGQADDHFGATIAIALDYTIIVGAPLDNDSGLTDLGAAYIFSYNGSTWLQNTKLNVSEANANSYDLRGSAVAISADTSTVFVGAPGVDGPSGSTPGAVYVFTNSGGIWSQTQKIQGPTTAAGGLGWAMTLSRNGTTLMVAGLYSPGGPLINHGIVRVYEKISDNWTEIDTLIPSDSSESDEFGEAIAMTSNGATVVIGAPNINSASGQAYIFTKNSGVWTQRAILSPVEGSIYGKFGAAAAIDSTGTQIAVGAWLNRSGAIYTLAGSGSSWEHTQILTTPDIRNEHLGMAIGMSNNAELIVGGANWANSNAQSFDTVGAVYTFIKGYQVFLPNLIR